MPISPNQGSTGGVSLAVLALGGSATAAGVFLYLL